MKICYQHVAPEKGRPKFREMLYQLIERSKRSDTEFDIKFMEKAFPHMKYFISRYTDFLNSWQLLEAIIQREKEGYDGVIIGCFHDTCLKEARQVTKIPIVGPCESSLLFAYLMSDKFAIIAPSIYDVPRIREKVIGYQLTAKTMIEPLTVPIDTIIRSLEDPKELIQDFMEVSKHCVKEGAELIIPGCTLMSTIISCAGVNEIENGVPVLDCVVVSVKLLETLIEMKEKLGF